MPRTHQFYLYKRITRRFAYTKICQQHLVSKHIPFLVVTAEFIYYYLSTFGQLNEAVEAFDGVYTLILLCVL